MMAANVAVLALVLVLTAAGFFAEPTPGNKWIIAIDYTQLGLFWAFMIAWAWTLVKLYRDIKHSKKLLPNKRVFKLHGFLLFAFAVIDIFVVTCLQIGFRIEYS